MNRKPKQSFQCIFDRSHKVDSEQKLIMHMKKCKAMEKESYQCCQYNPSHWVKWNTIKQHEQKCIDRINTQNNQFKHVLPSEIIALEFSIPFDIDVSMVGSSNINQVGSKARFQSKYEEKNSMNKKKNQQKYKQKMWEQPDFLVFMSKKGYKQREVQQNIRYQQNSFMNNGSFLF